MRVLVACEYSGTVRDAFISRGHDAVSCDLLPTDKPGPHYQGDVFDIINDGFDLIIAHPPCTFLTNAGVCHLYNKDGSMNDDRLGKMLDGAVFFKKLLDAPIKRRCIENPIMHRHAIEIVGRRQNQVVQPWMFGHMEQKATCLWLEGLPLLKTTNDVKKEMMKLPNKERQRLHWLSPSPNRWKERSKTFQGLADAMAEQWSV